MRSAMARAATLRRCRLLLPRRLLRRGRGLRVARVPKAPRAASTRVVVGSTVVARRGRRGLRLNHVRPTRHSMTMRRIHSATLSHPTAVSHTRWSECASTAVIWRIVRGRRSLNRRLQRSLLSLLLRCRRPQSNHAASPEACSRFLLSLSPLGLFHLTLCRLLAPISADKQLRYGLFLQQT